MLKNSKRVLAMAMIGVLSIGSIVSGTTGAGAAKKIRLSRTVLSLKTGGKATIKLKNVKKKKAKKIKWKTSDKKVVKVSPVKKTAKAKIKAVGAGKATVRAKLSGKTYRCKVTVKAVKKEQNLVMLRDTYATYVGTAVGVRPSAVGDSSLDMSRLTYTSSDPSVAKIVGTLGAVEGVSAGTATITIKTDMGNTMTATVKVFASIEEADELNDFYQKNMNDKIHELEKEGTYVEGEEIAGVRKQIVVDRNKMVLDFSDEYLKASENGKKYADNTSEDAIASIRTVFAEDEATREAKLVKGIREKLEPLSKAKTKEEILDINSQFIASGENGFWETNYNVIESDFVSTADGVGKVELKANVPFIEPKLIAGTMLDHKSDYEDKTSAVYMSLGVMVEETLRMAGESEEEIARNKPILLNAFEQLTPVMTYEEIFAAISAMDPKKQDEYLTKNNLILSMLDVARADKFFKTIKPGSVYRAAGFSEGDVIMSEETDASWKKLEEMIEKGDLDVVRELLKFCYTYNYIKYTKSGYTALKNYESDKDGALVRPSEKTIRQGYDNMVVQTLCYDMGWDTEKLYIDYLGGEKIRQELYDIGTLFTDEYREAFKECPWISEKGREAAIKKLDKMKIVIFSPDIKTYFLHEDLQTAKEGGTVFSNLAKLHKSTLDSFKLCVGKELNDRDLYWFVLQKDDSSPMSANAGYFPGTNSFTVYAGIIGPETYKSGDEVYNLGRMGFTAGHEIGHGFDSNGAYYDGDGNLNPWLPEEDAKVFESKKEKCLKLYDNYSVFYDKPTETIYFANGGTELSENMADLGAVEMAVRIVRRMNDPEKMKRLFKELGMFWFQVDYDPTWLTLDDHGPSCLRGSVPFQMFEDFYTVFGIKEGDAMYMAPEHRFRLWS